MIECVTTAIKRGQNKARNQKRKTTYMATPKQTKTAPTSNAPANTPAGATPEKAAKEEAAGRDRLFYVADLAKGAPQARGIVQVLKTAGDAGMTRKELCEKCAGVITTRQPMNRIVAYYQKDLVAAGAIRIEKAVPTVVAAAPAATTAS